MLSKPVHCLPCSLYGDGKGFSELEGSGISRLLVLAEALGEHEEEDGLPLRPGAPAGRLFQRAIREMGIPRNQLLITNLVRCRPPNNELRGAPYERAALDHCEKFLSTAINRYQPSAILALGDLPMRELTGYSGILTYRGFIYSSKYNIPVVPTYHPALLARGALGTLFGVFKRDIKLSYSVAQQGVPKQLETHYELHPTVNRVREFLDYLRANLSIPLAYDVETVEILGMADSPKWAEKKLVQIQFSVRPGQAIVVPWTEPYLPLIFAILALSNPKWGWNSRSSDDVVLTANGVVIGGERHDLMNAWQHLHPDFSSSKEDKGGGEQSLGKDKDIVAKLMGLQSALSFFAPEEGPWKHLSGQDLQLYGAKDVDYTQRCGIGIFKALESQGLTEGYRKHKFELRSVLDDMGARGIPIDRQKQTETRQWATTELGRLQEQIQKLAPLHLRELHPSPKGYRLLRTKVQVVGAADKVSLDELIETHAWGVDSPPLLKYTQFVGELVNVDDKWCVRKLFNVGSASQLISYIKWKGYRVPTKIDDPSKETTVKDELAKLAEETGDELLLLTDQYRKFAKLSGSYVGKVGKDGVVYGDWVPGSDGRVHPEFGWGPASAQLKCVAPNAQQFPEHGPLAKRAKAMIVAEPNHTFVKIDMRGFHSRMIGFLAEDAAYYKLSDFDVHSFVTAHFLQLHDAPYLLDMADDELRAALDQVKAVHKDTRNSKVKRVVHGQQFGLGINKLYNMYALDFNPTPEQAIAMCGEARWAGWSDEQRGKYIAQLGRREAMKLMGLLRQLFPLVFDDKLPGSFPYKIAHQIRDITPCRLRSPFSHQRWFWDWDKEKSTAYLPSNCAHCHIQYGLLILNEMGALDRYQLINFTHDALWYHCPTELVGECLEVTKRVLERKSDVLVNKWGAFFCNSDAEVGQNLVDMHGV